LLFAAAIISCSSFAGVAFFARAHRLVVVAVYGLLAQQAQLGLLTLRQCCQQLGHSQWLQLLLCADVDGTVSTHRQRSAQRLLQHSNGATTVECKNLLLLDAHLPVL
jgi:hypothetical protein